MFAISIKPFPGDQIHELAHAGFIESVKNAAILITTPHASGWNLLGFIATASEWALIPDLPADQIPFVPFARPAEPAEEPADTYDGRFRTHGIKLDRFIKERTALGQLTTAFLAALDPISIAHISDHSGLTSTLTRPLREMVAILEAKFGTIPQTQLSAYVHKLDDPLPAGGDVRHLVAAHTEIHRVLAKNRNKIPNAAKIRHLREALHRSVGDHFEAAHGAYEERCRLADVEMDWGPYTEALIAASHRFLEQATAGNAGYNANAAMGPTSATDPFFAAAVAAAVTKEIARLKLKPSQTPPPPRTLQYCFTHGWQYSHTGTTCKNRCPKHNPKQTSPGTDDGSSTKDISVPK
jgi:hypothetical protein